MNLKNLVKAISSMSEHARDLDQNDLLGRLGLERRRGGFERALTAFGLFGAGLVVGAGVGLVASPMAPAEVRKKIAEGVKTAKKELYELVSATEEQGPKPLDARPAKNGGTFPS